MSYADDMALKCKENPKDCGCLGTAALCIKEWQSDDYYHPFCFQHERRLSRVYPDPHIIKSCTGCPDIRSEVVGGKLIFTCGRFHKEINFEEVLMNNIFPEFCTLEVRHME